MCMKSEYPIMNDIFSKKKTKHRMDLKFAKTNRLKNSSIPFLQRILNSENLEFKKQELKRKMKFHWNKILCVCTSQGNLIAAQQITQP